MLYLEQFLNSAHQEVYGKSMAERSDLKSSTGVAAPSSSGLECLAEKEELISHILELQNTLHDLSQRVNSVKEENSRLKSENQVLNKYIENLMISSGIFKSTAGKWPTGIHKKRD